MTLVFEHQNFVLTITITLTGGSAGQSSMTKTIVIQNNKCVARAPKVEFFDATDFPFHADKINICTELEGGAGRAMKMSVQITTGRGKIVGSAENEIADFTGKTKIDHIIDFQPLTFPESGTYRLIVDIGTSVFAAYNG